MKSKLMIGMKDKTILKKNIKLLKLLQQKKI